MARFLTILFIIALVIVVMRKLRAPRRRPPEVDDRQAELRDRKRRAIDPDQR